MSTFNLQRQLDAAADQRRLAAGLAAERSVDAADDEVAPPPPDDADAILDLRDPASVLTYRPATAAAAEHANPGGADPQPAAGDPSSRAAGITLPVWQGPTDDPATSTLLPPIDAIGSTIVAGTSTEPVATRTPTKDRCPRCAGKVRLERFDLDQGIAIMRCTDCGVRYRAKSPKG